jgi:isopentenyl phosphate kinase
MGEKRLILVKLGGSLITNKAKPFTKRPAAISRLADEIHQARQQLKKLIIVGHGGGSYPHVPAKKFKTNQGLVGENSCQGIAEVQDAASRLNRIIVKAFLKSGEKAVSFNPSSFLIAQNREIKTSFLTSLEKALDFGMLPIVYGDVAFDSEIGCCILSTEMIFNHLVKKLRTKFKIEKIICAGTTNGVYGSKGKVVSIVSPSRFNQLKRHLGGSEGIDVTGGMVHKVAEALKLTKLGIKTLIIDGQKKNNLKKAILGQPVLGTQIVPD